METVSGKNNYIGLCTRRDRQGFHLSAWSHEYFQTLNTQFSIQDTEKTKEERRREGGRL
jgi:hypothetical protein